MSQDAAPKAPASELQRVCSLFIERWQPADPREQDWFGLDFMAMARSIHCEASEQFLAAIGLSDANDSRDQTAIGQLDAWRHEHGAMSVRHCFVARWAPESAQVAAFGADLIALTLAINRDAARPCLAVLDLQARFDRIDGMLRPANVVISRGPGPQSKG